MSSSTCLIQPVSKTTSLIMGLKNIIVSRRTKYQLVQIVELEEFGISLVLDRLVQSTEADEFIYHESLVHPALVTHPNPGRVLIIGGGEGATLREVLKHNSVSRAVMVDIDGELVNLAREYLKVMHRGSFDDPRSEVIIMDGKKYIEETNESYDVIIIDLTDPHGPEISKLLYSKEFYMMVRGRLLDGGLIVTQAGNSFYFPNTYSSVLRSLREVFPIVREYWVWIPSFGYSCNFILASTTHDPSSLTPEEVNEVLRRRGVITRFYNGRVHTALMNSSIILNTFSQQLDNTFRNNLIQPLR